MKEITKVFAFVLLLAAGMIMQSCAEDSDPRLAQVSLEIKAQTTQSTISNGRQMNSGLVFNEVLVGVTELEFETLEEDELEDIEGEDENEEVEFEGQFVVDLINGTSTPDFGIASLTPGIYEEMEIEMEPILDGGYSIYVSFEFVNANDEVVTVEYGNSDELEFEIENDNGFLIDAGVTNQMLVLLNLDALFAGVDLNTAGVDIDGIVRINSNSNSDLAVEIASNLDQILEAGEDDDDDGEIDED
ncbi:hypothetical protein OO013_09610 [Mangrovivirga sp. M17]|uniref:DUF4382 domain-containing protein n=1 Tax=Mangrovivirga halotolerans TaxID=2993936 RepID=A0ABT3RQQ9_9BACT|nr:hypothetical protein [Mangrovivirga halotolerans]MCX2744122.1 hypothetical protein [Mangrovivirga halotolerans]